MRTIRKILRAGVPVGPWPYLRVGERVRIIRGALSGLRGLLIPSKGLNPLIVSVDLLRRSVDSNSVSRVSDCGPAICRSTIERDEAYTSEVYRLRR